MTFPFVNAAEATTTSAAKLRREKRRWKLYLRPDGEYLEAEVVVEAHWMRVQGSMVCFFNDHPSPTQDDILVAGHLVDLVAQFHEVGA